MGWRVRHSQATLRPRAPDKGQRTQGQRTGNSGGGPLAVSVIWLPSSSFSIAHGAIRRCHGPDMSRAYRAGLCSIIL